MSSRVIRSFAFLSVFVLAACNDDSGTDGGTTQAGTAGTAETGSSTNTEEESASNSMTGDGDGDQTGDGDGDQTGDGDGDQTGDGDGDQTGDGDGDGDPGDGDPTGDGDGDGDPTGDGDGDGDPTGDGDGDGMFCGNGNIDVGEECDDGIDNGPGLACKGDCTINICGDLDVGPDEGCDDGNLVNGDGCTLACLIENPDPEILFCGNKVYECGDIIDNDMDGLVDLDDPECTSPCDDDESSFLTELPGQNNDCKADCYFDGDSGAGNDACEWNLKCDPENPGAGTMCEYDPAFMMCDLNQPQQCLDFCAPLVPNGCDCFGCCEIDSEFVYLGNGNCSLDSLDQCESCTQHLACVNLCDDPCEVCFGQDPEDLPPECMEPVCPMGVMSCIDIADCAVGDFCQTGCCVPIQ
jgi:hypothetical protein